MMTDRSHSPVWADSVAPTRMGSPGPQDEEGAATAAAKQPTIRFDEEKGHPGRAHSTAQASEQEGQYVDTTRNNSVAFEDQHKHDVERQQHQGEAGTQCTTTTVTIDIYHPDRPKLGLRERLHHFTWAWYTLPMSTGGLAVLIRAQPHHFSGLKTIGLVVYCINIVIFTAVSLAMLCRFFLHSGSMARSITHPREGFFVPTAFLALATIITGTERYAIPPSDMTLKWAIQMAFWVYVVLTAILSVAQYSYVFAGHSFGLQTMMPTWILPIFPIMLSGTIASVIAETQPEIRALPIIVAGLTCQGLGLSVAVLMYAHMIGRLMQSGLPNREHRPGLFMCVGPPAFTALALIGMAKAVPQSSLYIDVRIIRAIALMCAIFLWALSLWWFAIALVAVVSSPPKYFHLGWWAMVFPNTGFTLATISIGKELGNHGVLWVTSAMSICIVLTFFFVLYNHVRAAIKQDIMYPGRDEDVED